MLGLRCVTKRAVICNLKPQIYCNQVGRKYCVNNKIVDTVNETTGVDEPAVIDEQIIDQDRIDKALIKYEEIKKINKEVPIQQHLEVIELLTKNKQFSQVLNHITEIQEEGKHELPETFLVEILKQIDSNKHYKLMYKIYNLLNVKKELSQTTYISLMIALGKFAPEIVARIFKIIKKKNYSDIPGDLCAQMIQSASKNENFKLAEEMFSYFKSKNYELTENSYHFLISCYSTENLSFYKAVQLFNELKGKNIPISEGIYNNIIKVYCYQQKFDKAISLINEIDKNKIFQLNKYSLAPIIRELALHDKIDEAFKFATFAIDRDIDFRGIFEEIALTSYKNYRADIVDSFCNFISDNNIKIDFPIVFNTILQTLLNQDEQDAATLLFDHVTSKKLADHITYFTIISYLYTIGHDEDAFNCYLVAKKNNIVFPLRECTLLIDLFGDIGDFKEIKDLMQIIQSNNITLDLPFYNVVITSLGKIKRASMILKIYDRLVSKNEINITILNSVVSSLCSCGYLEDAKRIYVDDYSKLNIEKNAAAIDIGFTLFGSLKDFNFVNDIFKSGIDKGFSSKGFYGNAILAAVDCGERETAKTWLRDMAVKGFKCSPELRKKLEEEHLTI